MIYNMKFKTSFHCCLSFCKYDFPVLPALKEFKACDCLYKHKETHVPNCILTLIKQRGQKPTKNVHIDHPPIQLSERPQSSTNNQCMNDA